MKKILKAKNELGFPAGYEIGLAVLLGYALNQGKPHELDTARNTSQKNEEVVVRWSEWVVENAVQRVRCVYPRRVSKENLIIIGYSHDRNYFRELLSDRGLLP